MRLDPLTPHVFETLRNRNQCVVVHMAWEQVENLLMLPVGQLLVIWLSSHKIYVCE
jgi:hypothetical protein